MRPFAILLGACALAPVALSVSIEKSILVTYKKNTPHVAGIVDEAKQLVENAGGRVTHTFKFIDGFSADVPEEIVDVLREKAPQWITIEEDRKVRIAGGS